MKLEQLCANLPVLKKQGDTNTEISGLCGDSRKVKIGDLFVALKGTQVDGRQFIDSAISSGARAIVSEDEISLSSPGVALLQVANAAQALAILASNFYQHPSRNVPCVGITGTNGKTTSAYLLEAILEKADRSPAVFGTINYRHGDQVLEASHTTPQSNELQRLMNLFVNKGAGSLILEVSSHALVQHRADALDYDVALFTNLTPEHLDFHKDMEDYFAAKSLLFNSLLPQSHKKKKSAVLNWEDVYGKRLAEESLRQNLFGTWIFSREEIEAPARALAVYPAELSYGVDGIHAKIHSPQGLVNCESALVGEHNLSNLLGVIAVSLALEIPISAIEAGIRGFRKVPGRLEKVDNSQNKTVFVDYAHTPDALKNVLAGLRGLQKREARLRRGKLYVLFGCGGDRDKSKRPLMAQAVAESADFAWVTSDNPRTENAQDILDQVVKGFEKTHWKSGEQYQVEPDRALAIQKILQQANEEDIVLIAGKGHEDYQIVGKQKFHFDDREEVEKFLGKRP